MTVGTSPPNNLADLIQKLSAEPSPLARRWILLAAKNWWSPETLTQFYDEALRLMHIDIPQAERVARSAVWLSQNMGDELAHAASLRALGHIFCARRRYEPALELYQQAAGIYERHGEGSELELGRTLNGSLQTLFYLGRYDQAMAYAEQARSIFTRHGDRLRLARLDTNMGNMMFRQDRFEEALELYGKAHEAFREIGQPQDVAIALKNTATCQISLNDFNLALETYQQARDYCVQHEMPLLVAVADYNIAYLYYLRGEYTKAIELYRSVREHCHSLGDIYREGLCDLDQSEMYLELNLSEEGAYLARQALETFRGLGVGYEAAKALTNLAISLSHRGDYRMALDLFRKARDLFREEHNHAWIAFIDLYQAIISHRERRFTEARLLCERALEFFAPSPLAPRAILCELLLARIHLDAGRAPQAKQVCQTALDRLSSAETPALAYQAWFVLGMIEESLNAPDAAYQAYLKAHQQLENLRSHLPGDEMRISFLKDKLEVYESLVRMCLIRGDAPENSAAAFAYIEQAKSRSLADLIAFRAHQLPPSAGSGHVVERVSSLRQDLNWLHRTIQLQENQGTNTHDPHLDRLRRSARECEHHLLEEMANLRIQDKEFVSLHTAGSIDLDAIRSVLPDDSALLQYYRVGNVFYACVLSRTSLRFVTLGSFSALRRSLQLLRFQLSKFRLGPDYVQTFSKQLLDATNAHLHEFYRQLIEPIEDDLKAGHLIVAPHGFLHYLPFHAVLGPDGYLGQRYSISYTPSASVFYLVSTRNHRAESGSLVLGIPDPVAPQILDEVQAVASSLPDASTYIGPAATAEVLRTAGSRSRYVHIATHGRFRQDNPMFSSISLGNSELSLFDLYQLHLPAELVTLSGCGTGLNVVVGGDELMGLKRGLLYAGAQGVLLTLWDVNDQSTAEFMKLFYSRLQRDRNKSSALQYAMSELRNAYPHPFYWAPFMLVGKYL